MWGMPMYGEWGWMSVGVMMLLVWVPVIALGAWIVSRIGGIAGSRADNVAPNVSARELLDQRYAAGDVSREQYLQMVSDLDDRRAGTATR